jgi:hypothetical protein
MQYHVIEIQRRPDGINNVLEIVSRNTLATGLSYYYDRCSKMAATTLYVSVTLILIDSDGTIIENKKIPTAYQPESAE